jgi:hypothetical protein
MCEGRVVANTLLSRLSRLLHARRRNLVTPHGGEVRTMDEQNTPIAEKQKGGIGYVLLWILGVPIPILILIFLVRGCT